MLERFALVLLIACKHGDTGSATPTESGSPDSAPPDSDTDAPDTHPPDSANTETDTDTYIDADSGDSAGDSGTTMPCDTAAPGDVSDHYSPGPWLSVSCSSYHCCGLRNAGTVSCWGYENGSGATTDVPCGNDFTHVATGYDASCAIRSDNTLTCWGVTGNQTYLGHTYDFTPPVGSFSDVAIGLDYACAVSAVDGATTCWGYDVYGDHMPAPTGSFSDLEMGGGACALASDGSATCWGNVFVGPPPGGTFSAVGIGIENAAGIDGDNGLLETWSTISADACGEWDVPADQVVAFDFGENWYGCAIRAADGGIDCWGLEGGASCPWSSLGGTGAVHILTDIPAGTFTSLSAGDAGVCAIDVDGGMTCWGNPDRDGGQFNPPD